MGIEILYDTLREFSRVWFSFIDLLAIEASVPTVVPVV